MSNRSRCKQKQKNVFGSELEVNSVNSFTCAEVKEELHCKSSLPEQQRRLVFPKELGQQLGKQGGQVLVQDLQTWQAIVFQNDKSVGRLVSPRIQFSQYAAAWQKAESILCYSLIFDRWIQKNSKSQEKFQIEVGSNFQTADFRIQLFGKVRGENIRIPFAHKFSGQQVWQELQTYEYRQSHLEKTVIEKPEYSIQFGEGIEQFLLTFISSTNKWYLSKCELRFAVVDQDKVPAEITEQFKKNPVIEIELQDFKDLRQQTNQQLPQSQQTNSTNSDKSIDPNTFCTSSKKDLQDNDFLEEILQFIDKDYVSNEEKKESQKSQQPASSSSGKRRSRGKGSKKKRGRGSSTKNNKKGQKGVKEMQSDTNLESEVGILTEQNSLMQQKQQKQQQQQLQLLHGQPQWDQSRRDEEDCDGGDRGEGEGEGESEKLVNGICHDDERCQVQSEDEVEEEEGEDEMQSGLEGDQRREIGSFEILEVCNNDEQGEEEQQASFEQQHTTSQFLPVHTSNIPSTASSSVTPPQSVSTWGMETTILEQSPHLSGYSCSMSDQASNESGSSQQNLNFNSHPQPHPHPNSHHKPHPHQFHNSNEAIIAKYPNDSTTPQPYQQQQQQSQENGEIFLQQQVSNEDQYQVQKVLHNKEEFQTHNLQQKEPIQNLNQDFEDESQYQGVGVGVGIAPMAENDNYQHPHVPAPLGVEDNSYALLPDSDTDQFTRVDFNGDVSSVIDGSYVAVRSNSNGTGNDESSGVFVTQQAMQNDENFDVIDDDATAAEQRTVSFAQMSLPQQQQQPQQQFSSEINNQNLQNNMYEISYIIPMLQGNSDQTSQNQQHHSQQSQSHHQHQSHPRYQSHHRNSHQKNQASEKNGYNSSGIIHSQQDNLLLQQLGVQQSSRNNMHDYSQPHYTEGGNTMHEYNHPVYIGGGNVQHEYSNPPSQGGPVMHEYANNFSQVQQQSLMRGFGGDQSSNSPLTMDVERFLIQTMPSIEMDRSSNSVIEQVLNIRLSDLWKFYEAPSYFGREVYTLGGSRGPSEAYYLPYLSAIQLFVPENEKFSKDSKNKKTYVCESPPEGYSQNMNLLFEFFETSQPHLRPSMHLQLQRIEKGFKDKFSKPFPEIMDFRIGDLHPSSWFAVAWYPIYRIPQTSLNARFLTYHSLYPAIGIIKWYENNINYPISDPHQNWPVILLETNGFKYHNLMDEKWFEIPEILQYNKKADNKSGQDQGQGQGQGQRQWNRVPQSSKPEVLKAMKQYFQNLESVAYKFANGDGIKVQGEKGLQNVMQDHMDFEFFNTRG